jgi:hypothetical protein
MEKQQDGVVAVSRQAREWAKLLRKLRWVGLDEEAQRLELALSTLPPEERGPAVELPDTD